MVAMFSRASGAGMDALLDRGILGRRAEGVEAHRIAASLKPLAPLQARCGRSPIDVWLRVWADMDPCPTDGEHLHVPYFGRDGSRCLGPEDAPAASGHPATCALDFPSRRSLRHALPSRTRSGGSSPVRPSRPSRIHRARARIAFSSWRFLVPRVRGTARPQPDGSGCDL